VFRDFVEGRRAQFERNGTPEEIIVSAESLSFDTISSSIIMGPRLVNRVKASGVLTKRF
jgi:hypothetical protein